MRIRDFINWYKDAVEVVIKNDDPEKAAEIDAHFVTKVQEIAAAEQLPPSMLVEFVARVAFLERSLLMAAEMESVAGDPATPEVE